MKLSSNENQIIFELTDLIPATGNNRVKARRLIEDILKKRTTRILSLYSISEKDSRIKMEQAYYELKELISYVTNKSNEIKKDVFK